MLKKVNSEANARRVTNVEQCFGSSGQPLALQGRVLVGEGVLTKLCRKKPKPRQFFLFNDTLVYGNIVIHKKKYNKQHILPLEDVKLENVQDQGALRNGWKIISPSKSFVVFAATATEKKEWMAHIRKCVSDVLTRRGGQMTNSPDSPVYSPVWVPDSQAKTCMHCRKSEFSMVNRRHHCRHCGIVCCNACSNKRWLLPKQSSKPIRVCLTCYHKLSQESKVDEPGNYASPGEEDSGEDSSEDEDEVRDMQIPGHHQGEGGQLNPQDAYFQSYN